MGLTGENDCVCVSLAPIHINTAYKTKKPLKRLWW